MRPDIRFFVPALLSLAACLPTQKNTNSLNLEGQSVRLTVLHTSDIHSRFLPYDLAPLKTDADLGLAPEAPPYGGAARLAALIKRERARADRSLLVDSGDYWQGGPIFNASDGEPEMRWMSLMGYDGVVMGNHEFDKGVMNFSDKFTRFGHFPLLAANYWWENRGQANSTNFEKMSAPYQLANVNGVRIALLGMASIGSMYGLVDGGNSVQATPLEQNECARAYVEMLRPTVDLVLVVSHLGLTEDQDLITGYDAYYPYESALPFLSRPEGDLTRWTQIEPPLSACEAEGTPREKCTFLDGTVRVFIPGVSGIDVIEGGHLHIVLNPPQVLRDPTGRPVILSHSGAFAKYLGRLELELQMPPARPPDLDESSDEYKAWYLRKLEGAEVIAHDYHAYPVDSIWCDDEARSWRSSVQYEQFKQLITTRPTENPANPDTRPCRDRYWDEMKNAGVSDEAAVACIEKYDRDFRGYECDRYIPTDCLARIERCSRAEDRPTTALLSPYVNVLDQTYALTRIFAYAPREIARRNSSSGGDSPLGNMTSESMRIRQRVQAEFALTNTLGVRDNIYPGPVSLEAMFNVFPFENTINIMYLSGAEVQELADYVGQRSGERGCQAQAQISGWGFVMDCAQHQVNVLRFPCESAKQCFEKYGGLDHQAPAGGWPEGDEAHGWQCTEEQVCWGHTAYDIRINGKPLDKSATYKIAVNDYIARGGSGFKVLKRNTTRIETNISLRDSLIDYLRGQCTCQDILGLSEWNKGKADVDKKSAIGYSCARAHDGESKIIDPIAVSWCKQALTFEDLYGRHNGGSQTDVPLPGLDADACTCSQVLSTPEAACPTLNTEVLNQACNTPLAGTTCSCADVLTRAKSCGTITDAMRLACTTPLAGEGSCTCAQAVCPRASTDEDPNPLKAYCSLSIGKCTCAAVMAGDEKACGHIPRDLKNFCSSPTRVSIAVGEEDGRIGRRVK